MPTRGVFRFFVIPELNTLTKQNLNHQRIKKVSTTDKRFLRFSVDRQYYQFKDTFGHVSVSKIGRGKP